MAYNLYDSGARSYLERREEENEGRQRQDQTGYHQPGFDPGEMERKWERVAQGMERMGVGRGSAVPPPECFEIGKWEELEDFWGPFERYCQAKWDKGGNSWSQVLGYYLKGEIGDAFRTMGGSRRPYEEIKAELGGFFGGKHKAQDEYVQEFLTAKRYGAESLTCLAIRLGRLASIAFPTFPIESRGDLVKSTFERNLSESIHSQLRLLKMASPEKPFIEVVRELQKEEERMEKSRAMIAAFDNPPPMVMPQAFSSNEGEAPRRQQRQEGGQRDRNEGRQREKRPDCRHCGKNNHREAECFRAPCKKCNRKGHKEDDCWAEGSSQRQCGYCHQTGHSENDCYRKTADCRNCHKIGHYERDCPSRRDRAQDTRSQERRQCAFCEGDGHGMKDCEAFKAMVKPAKSCTWCDGDHMIKNCPVFKEMLDTGTNRSKE